MTALTELDEAISEAAEQGTIQTPTNPYKETPL